MDKFIYYLRQGLPLEIVDILFSALTNRNERFMLFTSFCGETGLDLVVGHISL